MHSCLKEIQKRPGMYFGDPEQRFTRLMAFMDGYSLGYQMGSRQDPGWPKDLAPGSGFDEFVCRKFGLEYGADTKGWTRRIRERASSEEEAFDLFFRLFDEYEQESEPG